jgi:sugar lactone lactonase YvrE
MRFEPIDERRHILGEGPFWDEETERLYHVDIVGRLVIAYAADGAPAGTWPMPDVVSAAIPKAGGGLVVTLRDGAWLFDPKDGALARFAAPDGDPGNRSNEARTDPAGRLWIGTMRNNIGPQGESLPVDRSSGTLSVVMPDGTSRRVLAGIGISNTLCWSPEGDILYFGDSLASVLHSYRYDAKNAALSDREIFSDLKGHGDPDGSAIDEEGYLWNARWGAGEIVRFAPDGSVDRIIEVPVRQPTSCVFGGTDRKTLYVTSASHGLEKPGPLDGATLAAEADVCGERCIRFGGAAG